MSTFTGLTNICSCAEEAKQASQSMPTACMTSTVVITTSMFLVSSALTLASPWQQLSDQASLARAYETKGITAANMIVGVGAVLGLISVIRGSFLQPVRLLYSMSEDRLLPKWFSKVVYNGIPIVAYLFTGVAISALCLYQDYTKLIEASSIVILLQFLLSSIMLVLVRYQPDHVGICREYSDLDSLDSVKFAGAKQPRHGPMYTDSYIDGGNCYSSIGEYSNKSKPRDIVDQQVSLSNHGKDDGSDDAMLYSEIELSASCITFVVLL